jgi:hypothetical protein
MERAISHILVLIHPRALRLLSDAQSRALDYYWRASPLERRLPIMFTALLSLLLSVL